MNSLIAVIVILGVSLSSALQVSISTDVPSKVTVTYTNDLQYPVTFLKWNTPFDALSGGRAFSVHSQGAQIPYSGPVGKRAEPTYDDMMTINGRESVTTIVDLSSYFTFPETAEFHVQAVHALDVNVLGSSFSLSVESNVISLDFQANPMMPANDVGSADISFISCTAAQQSTVNTAWDLFKTVSAKAQTEAGKASTSATYKTFFGAYTDTRATKVLKTYANEVTASKGSGYAFNCAPPSCGGSGTYAYVYPNDPSTIYLCGQFWKSPTSGFDCTPGVIVHEASHFTVVGGTQDYAYGTTAAKNLATSTPDRAVANADNYEYFAESL